MVIILNIYRNKAALIQIIMIVSWFMNLSNFNNSQKKKSIIFMDHVKKWIAKYSEKNRCSKNLSEVIADMYG